MFIPEFWCGVLAVIFVEMASLILYAIYQIYKGGKK